MSTRVHTMGVEHVAVRLPRELIEQVDTFGELLRARRPWIRAGRSEALRELLSRGLADVAREEPRK